MKKLLLVIIIGIIFSTYSYSQDSCLDSCTRIDSIFFCNPCIASSTLYKFTVDSCTFFVNFSVYRCPGPPSTIKIEIFNFTTTYPYCGCCSLTPSQILPAAFDYIIKHSPWIYFNYLDSLSLGGCITNFSLVTSVCWLQTVPPFCGWGGCELSSCCIRPFRICKDSCGIISTIPLAPILAVPCDSLNPQCRYNIFCP
jgi:hypothetical protein